MQLTQQMSQDRLSCMLAMKAEGKQNLYSGCNTSMAGSEQAVPSHSALCTEAAETAVAKEECAD